MVLPRPLAAFGVDRLSHVGLWLAAFGSALQLVGLSWDSVMHRLDPSLAEHEDVLTLANPSHAMFLVGLALTVAGVAVELASSRRQRMATILAGGLLTLSAAALAVAFTTGSPLVGHSHSHGPAGHAHDEAELARLYPSLPGLLEVMHRQGTEKALDRLDELAASDPSVLAEAHNLAHEIGRASFANYGSAPLAFGHCRETFLSGCYHGVLQAYMDSVPQVTPQAIVALCGGVGQADSRRVILFQCIHGLGHGLYANLDNDLNRALRFCDAFGDQWSRDSCYGGVFMENINTAIDERSGTVQHHTHTDTAVNAASIRPDDPLYPCDTLDARFLTSCYMMQSSVILLLNNYDFPAGFQACDRAPGNYVGICYQSMGRDISGFSRRGVEQAVQLCSLGTLPQRDQCFVGAVKDFAYETYRAPEGFAFCARLETAFKTACYTAVGQQINGFYPDAAGRAAECAKAEATFADACRRGAQVA